MRTYVRVRPRRTILHADLDSFFASVEQRDDPRLRGRPVIVGGGVVLAASYEAKAFGVRTAMGGARGAPALPAGDRRPAAVLGVRGGEQGGVRVFDDTTPRRRGALDRRGVPRRARDGAQRRARRPRSPSGCGETCASRSGCPITVGVARTKFLAKVASGVAKPDGLLVVPPDGELAFLHPLPVERLWGVGPVTATKLRDRGHHDRRPGRAAPRGARSSRCSGARPAATSTRSPTTATRGRCSSAAGAARSARSARSAAAPLVAPRRRRRSSSRSSTASPAGCGRRDRVGRTVVLRLRFDDFSRATRSHTLPRATARTPRRSSRRPAGSSRRRCR